MISPSYGLGVGGAENQLNKLYNSLKKNLIDVTIISKKKLNCSNLFYPFNFYLKCLMQIIIRKSNIIHIHTFSSPAWIIASLNFLLKRKILIKITLSGKNSRLEKIKNKFFLRLFFLFIFRNRDIFFVAINKRIKKILYKLGVKKENIFEISNGVSINFKKEEVEKKIIKGKDIVYFGRLIKRKDILKILQLIKNKKLFHIKFDIYGEGPEKKFLEEYIKKNNLDNINIYKFKTLPQLLKEIKKYKFSINSSKSEGMSNSILESLSLGVPVICSNIEENRAMVKNNFNGYVYKNNSQLVKILKTCVNIKNYKFISANAIKSVEKFHITDVASKYIKTYQRLNEQNLIL